MRLVAALVALPLAAVPPVARAQEGATPAPALREGAACAPSDAACLADRVRDLAAEVVRVEEALLEMRDILREQVELLQGNEETWETASGRVRDLERRVVALEARIAGAARSGR